MLDAVGFAQDIGISSSFTDLARCRCASDCIHAAGHMATTMCPVRTILRCPPEHIFCEKSLQWAPYTSSESQPIYASYSKGSALVAQQLSGADVTEGYGVSYWNLAPGSLPNFC